MVDPIGLVGTLMGIVQVCGKLMSICYDYRMGVRDAPRDISRILDEVVSVGSIAQQLVKVIESDSAPSLSSLQAMGGDDGTLRRCLVELQDLTASLKLGKVSSSRRTLAWPLPRADAGKRLQVLAAIKSTLQLALAADNTWVVCYRLPLTLLTVRPAKTLWKYQTSPGCCRVLTKRLLDSQRVWLNLTRVR